MAARRSSGYALPTREAACTDPIGMTPDAPTCSRFLASSEGNLLSAAMLLYGAAFARPSARKSTGGREGPLVSDRIVDDSGGPELACSWLKSCIAPLYMISCRSARAWWPGPSRGCLGLGPGRRRRDHRPGSGRTRPPGQPVLLRDFGAEDGLLAEQYFALRRQPSGASGVRGGGTHDRSGPGKPGGIGGRLA